MRVSLIFSIAFLFAIKIYSQDVFCYNIEISKWNEVQRHSLSFEKHYGELELTIQADTLLAVYLLTDNEVYSIQTTVPQGVGNLKLITVSTPQSYIYQVFPNFLIMINELLYLETTNTSSDPNNDEQNRINIDLEYYQSKKKPTSVSERYFKIGNSKFNSYDYGQTFTGVISSDSRALLYLESMFTSYCPTSAFGIWERGTLKIERQ